MGKNTFRLLGGCKGKHKGKAKFKAKDKVKGKDKGCSGKYKIKTQKN